MGIVITSLFRCRCWCWYIGGVLLLHDLGTKFSEIVVSLLQKVGNAGILFSVDQLAVSFFIISPVQWKKEEEKNENEKREKEK